ncbi:hypothetical protein [Arcobacter sp. FWKO B]|uniref:hypothetical protein n=1 Tax=Arcobacter sp. FWKO B TaxID=2593672 RepID=UPI00190810FB|nr:hypothetical protein [Arcobacter sp. FWKO B]
MQKLFYKNNNYFLRNESKKCENWSFIKSREPSLRVKILKFTFYMGFFSTIIFAIS